MGRIVVEEYESWDLSPLYIPPRSTLYPLEPIGVGTPWVESLTSYMARLADAHCVFPGVLMYKMIVPMMPGSSAMERQHGSFRADGYKSNLINGVSHRAVSAVQALKVLTGRDDLHHLTLLALAELLPDRGLIRPAKAWCPTCYEEWRRSGQIVYDPLLWIFQEITICVKHQQRLRTHCSNPECARPIPALTWRSLPGYCAFCHWWLGTRCEEVEELSALEGAESRWHQWVTQSLSSVLSVMPGIPVPLKRQRVRQVMLSVVEQISKGNVSAFARALGTPRNKVDHWCLGDRIPEIDILLRLCYRLELSLCDFLFGEVEALRPHLLINGMAPALFTPRKRVAINKEHIYQSLEQAVESDEYPPPSLKEVGKRLGHEQTVLYKIHQVACHTITSRHLLYRHRQREKRLQGYCEEIRQIAAQLQAQGVSLTQKHIAPHLAQPGILRDPKVRELLWEVCRELETSNGGKSR